MCLYKNDDFVFEDFCLYEIGEFLGLALQRQSMMEQKTVEIRLHQRAKAHFQYLRNRRREYPSIVLIEQEPAAVHHLRNQRRGHRSEAYPLKETSVM